VGGLPAGDLRPDARLNKTKDGVKPYWALEVFGGGPGILSPEAFTRSGDVLGLDAANQIQAAFKSYPEAHVGSLATLEVFGKGSGLTSSKKTMSFVTNHDADRNPGEYPGHNDGATFILANQWLLASGYGSPQVFSSFEWETRDDSPLAKAHGLITNADCTSGSPSAKTAKAVRRSIAELRRTRSAFRPDCPRAPTATSSTTRIQARAAMVRPSW